MGSDIVVNQEGCACFLSPNNSYCQQAQLDRCLKGDLEQPYSSEPSLSLSRCSFTRG